MWEYRGQRRPPFAEQPDPNQESVWDYPRPPKLDWTRASVEVRHGETDLARTNAAARVLETASPPTYYLPPADVHREQLIEAAGSSMCEWKGRAVYWALADAPDAVVAWSYPAPLDAFAQLRDFFGFYPGRVACWVDGERVQPQPGYFYGGWVTSRLAGPFKGEPGTGHW